jgi:hypothetical protein
LDVNENADLSVNALTNSSEQKKVPAFALAAILEVRLIADPKKLFPLFKTLP